MIELLNASDSELGVGPLELGVSPRPLCGVDGCVGGPDPLLVVQTSPRIVDASDKCVRYRFVEFIGDLDTYTASHVEAALDEVAVDSGNVIVDLVGVSFCDSAGLRLIENFCVQISANEGHACSRVGARLTWVLRIENFGLHEPVTSARRTRRHKTSPASHRRVGPGKRAATSCA